MGMTALPHQDAIAEKLEHTYGQLAVHGLGSGKTFTSINAANKLNLPILSIVPAPLINNYKKELTNSGFANEARVVSYNHAVKNINDPGFLDYARKSLVVYDEAQRMGDPSSQRSQLAFKIPAAKKLMLSATPMRNSPQELIPLVNALSPNTLPEDEQEFKNKFLHYRETPVGFWGRVKGVKPGAELHPVNLKEFHNLVKDKVDVFNSVDRSEYPSYSETIFQVPMSEKQQASYNFVMGQYPALAYSVAHGIPHDKEEANFSSFLIGPRQVSNHPGAFNSSATDDDAPKIKTMADEIEKKYKTDKNFRGVSYSNFLNAGVEPLSRELKKRGIHHEVFNGSVSNTRRAEIVKDYNEGRTPVLLLSGAGAEGLDLKGTKLMQIMEPHWQETQIKQVRGRAIRYKSHSHLPENERHVEVQRYHSIPRKTFTDKMLGKKRNVESGIDEYIYDLAARKQKVNDAFMNALEGEVKDDGTKVAEVVKTKALMVDLDGTLTTGALNGMEVILPNRKEVLSAFKAKGYRIYGVTNRAIYDDKTTPADVHSMCINTVNLFGDLIDDVVFAPFVYNPEIHKPSPVLLQYCMDKFGIDESNTLFVGDTEDDENAAKAAGVPFLTAEVFFSDEKIVEFINAV